MIYGHVSPNFNVVLKQKIREKEKIGTVGPKIVDSSENSTYFDSNGNKTNGATTGPHLHITIKINGHAIDPLEYL